MIDLHIHSTFSDGSFQPEQLVDMAASVALTGLSLTDHDSMNGIERFLAACESKGIRGVPGVEISVEVDRGTMHMLGYFVDFRNQELEAVLRKVRGGRDIRNKQIVCKLNELGLDLSIEDALEFAGEDTVGRPHIAQAMLKKGYVSNIREAFDRYLAKAQPGYVDRIRVSPEEGIEKINGAGGVAVLSHPFTLDLGKEELRECVSNLKRSGLGGIEVYYPEHNHSQLREYLDLTREFGIVATGGTDFHGEINPDIKLGVGFGDLRVPDEIIGQLLERRPVAGATS